MGNKPTFLRRLETDELTHRLRSGCPSHLTGYDPHCHLAAFTEIHRLTTSNYSEGTHRRNYDQLDQGLQITYKLSFSVEQRKDWNLECAFNKQSRKGQRTNWNF